MFTQLLLIQSIALINGDLFTSTTHLTKLLQTEIAMVKRLETYLTSEQKRLTHIEQYLHLIKEDIRQAQGKEEFYFGNPVNAHLFIKHLTVEWEKMEQFLPKDLWNGITTQRIFPSTEDYTGSALALMRLQDTYRLPPSELANGQISAKFQSKRLTALECYDLGRIAYTHADFYHTMMWMQEALVHLDTERNNQSMDRIDILDHLAYATSQQGNIEHALAITEEILTLAPDHLRANNNKHYYEKVLGNRTTSEEQNSSISMRNDRPDDSWDERDEYEDLCRQNRSKLSAKQAAKLFCRYRHNDHSYLIYRPVKEEQLFDHPAIFLYHEIISDREIEQIKTLAVPRLQRAVVRDATTGTFKPADYRISKSAWLRNEESPVVARLSRLIEAVTNLTMTTAEDLQIANYGIGGHYEPHFDFAQRKETDPFAGLTSGNRIATWLTYMSDVERGGATVFPVSGAYVKPKKGNAAFWYNLLPSGEADYSTRHAACPVLLGNKWVANKWIHERGQEFRRRCGLNPESID